MARYAKAIGMIAAYDPYIASETFEAEELFHFRWKNFAADRYSYNPCRLKMRYCFSHRFRFARSSPEGAY